MKVSPAAEGAVDYDVGKRRRRHQRDGKISKLELS
jgi:hypothetical protein